MAGLYTEISIVAPSSARAGEIVNVEARIRNLLDYAFNITATMGRVNGEVLRFGAIHKVVGAGETESWYDSFIMPDKDVVVSVESWFEWADGWYSDDRTEKTIALEVVAPPVAGKLTRMELEYDETWDPIPVSNIPQGQRGIIHVWGRNDMASNQKMGIYWLVADPEGYVAQEYGPYWEMFWTGPGNEQGFLSSRFNLDKVGRYTIRLELLMNPDNPEIVDQYIGDLCTVAPAEEFAGTISKKELEYDHVKSSIPVY